MSARFIISQVDFIPVANGFTNNRVISSAQTLTPPANSGATKIMLQTITQSVRYTLDGTTPTAAIGFQLKAGDPPLVLPYYEGSTILKVIQEAATAELKEQWGK